MKKVVIRNNVIRVEISGIKEILRHRVLYFNIKRLQRVMLLWIRAMSTFFITEVLDIDELTHKLSKQMAVSGH